MWKIFQLLVVFAVMASNVAWPWTDNTTVAAFLALVAAVWATLIVGWVSDLWLRLSTRRFSRKNGLQEAGLGRIAWGSDQLVPKVSLDRAGHESARHDRRRS